MSLVDRDEINNNIPKLTRANYLTWIEYVKDYIIALDHSDAADIWDAFEWESEDPNQ